MPLRIQFTPSPLRYNRNNWTYEFRMGTWTELTEGFVTDLGPTYVNLGYDVLSYQFSYLNVRTLIILPVPLTDISPITGTTSMMLRHSGRAIQEKSTYYGQPAWLATSGHKSRRILITRCAAMRMTITCGCSMSLISYPIPTQACLVTIIATAFYISADGLTVQKLAGRTIRTINKIYRPSARITQPKQMVVTSAAFQLAIFALRRLSGSSWPE